MDSQLLQQLQQLMQKNRQGEGSPQLQQGAPPVPDFKPGQEASKQSALGFLGNYADKAGIPQISQLNNFLTPSMPTHQLPWQQPDFQEQKVAPDMPLGGSSGGMGSIVSLLSSFF